MNDNQKLVWVVDQPHVGFDGLVFHPLYVCKSPDQAKEMAIKHRRRFFVLDNKYDVEWDHDGEIVIYPEPQPQVWIVAWGFMWGNDQEVDTIHVCETLDVARMMAMEAINSGEFNSDRPDYLEFKDKDSVDAHHQVVIYPVPMVSRLTVQ